MLRSLFCFLVLMCGTITILPAQVMQLGPVKQINFKVRWTENPLVDSTVINVYISIDSPPVYRGRGISPALVSVPAVGTTATYKFILQSFRGGIGSSPGESQFVFDANQYYRVTRLVTPAGYDTSRTAIARWSCGMYMFNDSTFVLRTYDQQFPGCTDTYQVLDTRFKQVGAVQQQLVDGLCTLRDTVYRGCTFPYLLAAFGGFAGLSELGPVCSTINITPSPRCVTNTIVMDFFSLYTSRYSDTLSLWRSGGQLPARWTTGYNYVFIP